MALRPLLNGVQNFPGSLVTLQHEMDILTGVDFGMRQCVAEPSNEQCQIETAEIDVFLQQFQVTVARRHHHRLRDGVSIEQGLGSFLYDVDFAGRHLYSIIPLIGHIDLDAPIDRCHP